MGSWATSSWDFRHLFPSPASISSLLPFWVLGDPLGCPSLVAVPARRMTAACVCFCGPEVGGCASGGGPASG